MITVGSLARPIDHTGEILAIVLLAFEYVDVLIKLRFNFIFTAGLGNINLYSIASLCERL